MRDRDKQGIPPAEKDLEEQYLEDTNTVASTMECTGLMPTPPLSDVEGESYSDIYPIPVAEPADKKALGRTGSVGSAPLPEKE